jgi:hypothetical protein
VQLEQRNRLRRAATQRELEGLHAAIAGWLAVRRARDVDERGRRLGRYDSQLRALETVLLDAANALLAGAGALDESQPTTTFYAACRHYERAVTWLRRLWEYFSLKFDQRDDAAQLGPLLRAAEEVVWSCYQQPFAVAGDKRQAPPPLAYVDPEYSPAAVRAHSVPLLLRQDAELSFLEPFLQSLPIALIRLPATCIGAPWRLIHVAHEVGHHVESELGLIGSVRQRLESAARAANLSEDRVKTWGSWSEEIFADMFSLTMMGQWVVWALAEEEWGPPEQMVRPKSGYPPPVIRLALVDRAAGELGLPTADLLPPGPSLESIAACHPRTMSDMAVVDAAVSSVLSPLPELGLPLKEVCGMNPSLFAEPDGTVARWARVLQTSAPVNIQPGLAAPRQVVSAAFAAWTEARDGDTAALADRITATIRQSGPPGTRAGAPRERDVSGLGGDLARRLLTASVSQE